VELCHWWHTEPGGSVGHKTSQPALKQKFSNFDSNLLWNVSQPGFSLLGSGDGLFQNWCDSLVSDYYSLTALAWLGQSRTWQMQSQHGKHNHNGINWSIKRVSHHGTKTINCKYSPCMLWKPRTTCGRSEQVWDYVKDELFQRLVFVWTKASLAEGRLVHADFLKNGKWKIVDGSQ